MDTVRKMTCVLVRNRKMLSHYPKYCRVQNACNIYFWYFSFNIFILLLTTEVRILQKTELQIEANDRCPEAAISKTSFTFLFTETAGPEETRTTPDHPKDARRTTHGSHSPSFFPSWNDLCSFGWSRTGYVDNLGWSPARRPLLASVSVPEFLCGVIERQLPGQALTSHLFCPPSRSPFLISTFEKQK